MFLGLLVSALRTSIARSFVDSVEAAMVWTLVGATPGICHESSVTPGRALRPEYFPDFVLGGGTLGLCPNPLRSHDVVLLPRDLAPPTSLSTAWFPGMPLWALAHEMSVVSPFECLARSSVPIVHSIPDLRKPRYMRGGLRVTGTRVVASSTEPGSKRTQGK